MPHTIATGRNRTRSRRLLFTDDENPLDGVANLFDATIVLSVALMIALLARPMLRADALADQAAAELAAATGSLQAGTPQMETVAEERETLQRFRISGQTIGGDGERLGMAYRLKTGEVICVTEEANGK